MKKKIVALLLTMGLAVSLAACGSSSSDSEEASSESSTETSSVSATSDSEETSVDGEYDYSVAFCVFTTEGDYWNYMYGLVEDAFAEYGVSVDIISADNDSVRQIEQIENCVSQGYDLILEIAVDPDAVADANARAMEQGVPVFQFIKDSGEGNRTSFRGTDEVAVGETLVELAMEWVNETFPDAEDGSINTIIVGGNSAGSETERYEAMVEKAEEYSQLNIVDTVRWETSQSYAQEATDNEITKFNGDIQVMIIGSGEMALGVRASILAEGSMITDYSTFGIFTCDISEETAEAIRAAANDEDVIRAAAVNGGDTVANMNELVEECMLVLTGADYEDTYTVEIAIATADNLSDFGY